MRFILLIAMLLQGAPTTQPTRETLEQAVSDAKAGLNRSISECVSRIETEDLKDLKAARDAKLAELEAARQGSDLELRMKLGSEYNKLKSEYEARFKALYDAEPKIAEAEQMLASAEKSLAKFIDDESIAAYRAARKRQEELEKDPIYRGIRDGNLVLGMTLEQARAAMKSEGRLSSEGEYGQIYIWKERVSSGPGIPIMEHHGTFRDGKLVELHVSEAY